MEGCREGNQGKNGRQKEHEILSKITKHLEFSLFLYAITSPLLQEFESGLLDIVYGFEQLAASFKPLVRDPKLSVYVNPPASDVVYALSHDVEEDERAKKIPWPDTELLFGEDPDYQHDVSQVIAYIKEEVENVQGFAKVGIFSVVHTAPTY